MNVRRGQSTSLSRKTSWETLAKVTMSSCGRGRGRVSRGSVEGHEGSIWGQVAGGSAEVSNGSSGVSGGSKVTRVNRSQQGSSGASEVKVGIRV